MNNIVDRDPSAMGKFAAKLSDFCDEMDQKAAAMVKCCEDAELAMQDQGGAATAQRLMKLVEDVRAQVANARALSDRISRSAAILTESEEEE